MRFNLSIQNIEELLEDLADLPDKAHSSIASANNFVAQSTAIRAKAKIKEPGRSGKIYTFGGRTHQASAPGEPPAEITGRLARSIRWTRMTDTPGSFATAGSNLSYARVLEFGGMNDDGQWVASRPFLFPAFREAINQAEIMLKREFEKRL